ncbi:hypothetical protein VTK56DRAFT_5221 [Thermocarpiscus australiensis]
MAASAMDLHEPIAIIGTGCRLPGGASSPSKLWDLLRKPRDLLKKIDRFDADGFYHPDGRHHGTANVRHAHLLDEDFRLFDPGFFGIKPVEAESIDPVQRLLLETVYESLEDAGIPLERLQGSDTAFYAGVMATDYTDLLMRDVDTIPQYFATATARSIISNRVSYVFDWHGPSMTIDTACSSSMLALHGAVTSLRTRECQVAVAAGGNLILGPELFIALSKVNMLSPRGRSAMWDASADGYGRGEGFVSVVLKRLSDAIRDGDHIDCVIRESATNQDGRTMGITMPSARAQADLIRKAYANVGLDLRAPRDRPQFFEAHGTGTKAGDPQEAEAIFKAFFGDDAAALDPAVKSHPLYVGGIKTVVGHTEGTAGLAGLMKAMLALRAGVIPPNQLFNELNPDLAPFYGPLKVPTEAIPWPPLPEGAPRRASVNSFGFGGANTHVILESYTPPAEPTARATTKWTEASSILPFVFSASSETSLQRTLRSYQEYLAQQPETDLYDLSWTLRARRSALPVKLAVSAQNLDELRRKIDEKLEAAAEEKTSRSAVGVRSRTGERRILGIFTGQGAQWAAMGKRLVEAIPACRDLVNRLDDALQRLPEAHRPSWRIAEELAKDAASSRMHEAAFSQPLCTVVQVLLVHLLRAAGVEFAAVVGHSSGEIAAAHAAGFLSAEDATKIAYLRGRFAGLARGPAGEKGAMMAVGASMEEATALCNLPEFLGKVQLAASNSPSSATLSGDAEAIAQVKTLLDGKKTFARLLKVDTAYHSHHMHPCAGPYVEGLEAAGIGVQSPPGAGGCTWYSSVLGGNAMVAGPETLDALRGTYWRDNMVNTVLFSQAVTAAVKAAGPFHFALEVGPHPALKGPASQTLAELGLEIPYSGTLARGESDLVAFSDCLGSVWMHLGAPAVNFDGIHALLPSERPTLLKNLPTYGWDHDKPYWYESRKSKQYRTRSQPSHVLLGSRVDDGSGQELRWRNFLSIQQVPWLEGHKIQGQVVFPAAGYISMVLEAAQVMAAGAGGAEEQQRVEVLEVRDLDISHAIVFPDEKTGIETTTTLSGITVSAGNGGGATITASFAISAHLSRDATHLTQVADGTVRVVMSSESESLHAVSLAPRNPTPAHLIALDVDRFYSSLDAIGYGYTREFRTCSDMRRRHGFCTGYIEAPNNDELLVHPGVLDQAFQALFGAYSWPGDGRFWTLFLPRRVRKVTVDPARCRSSSSSRRLAFDAWLDDESPPTEMRGEVVFSAADDDNNTAVLTMEGASMVSVNQTTARDDRRMFFESVWGVASPDGELAAAGERATKEEWETAEACERVAHYYWRRLAETLTPAEREACAGHHKHLLAAIEHYLTGRPMDGVQSYLRPEWRDDDEQTIARLAARFPDSIDIKLAVSVGRALPAVLRGETTMLEHMRPNNMLDDYYAQSLGLPASNRWLGRIARQLAHRFPRMHWLEIGAGTGSSTQAVLDAVGSAYGSYTFTDISSGFFERAAERFATAAAAGGKKMIFKTLDIEKDPAGQGYAPHSYDVIVASNVLHATADLHNTLSNVRALLKPGGYLLLLEITDNTTIRYCFCMGGLPGWWLGVGDGRRYSPCISPSAWNQALRKAGFAGVDAVTPARDRYPNPFSVIAAQAVDAKMELLRRPLFGAHPATIPSTTLYILGGRELDTSKMVEDIVANVVGHGRTFNDAVVIDTIENLAESDLLPPQAAVLNLLDLDGPVFKDVTPTRLRALQRLVERARNLLWVTRGAERQNPWAAASRGFLRSVAAELPTLRAQVLDFDDGDAEQPVDNTRQVAVVAEALLRLLATDAWEKEDPAFADKVLWTTEPELRFHDGRLWVPRVVEHVENNRRINVHRRRILREAGAQQDGEEMAVRLDEEEGGAEGKGEKEWVLRQHYVPKALPSVAAATGADESDTVALRVRYSTLRPLAVDESGSSSALFLAVGQLLGGDTGTGAKWHVALTAERCSVARVPRRWVVALPPDDIAAESDALQFLYALSVQYLARKIVTLAAGESGEEGPVVLIHEPDAALASALLHCARIKFSTQNPSRDKGGDGRWIYLHPRQSVRAAQQALPRNASAFVCFSEKKDNLAELIESALPSGCKLITDSFFFGKQPGASSFSGRIRDAIASWLTDMVGSATTSSTSAAADAHVPVVSLEALQQQQAPFHNAPLNLVDWHIPASLPVEVSPPQPSALFRRDRSYMLVGMTAEMGKSLCRWMVRHGAGTVIMTSRNPKVDPRWIEELEAGGAKIKVAGFDATSREAWDRFAAEIRRDLPPLAGIINGAVVLQDRFFLEMDVETFNGTLRPKVDSTLHLDAVFRHDPLDFFLIFSSLSSVIGNRGQANYNAANGFITAVARQRRARGQAASVLQLGSVVGVGFLTRAGDVMEQILVKYGYLPVSEVDLHHLVAQCIMAGLPGSGETYDLTTGLRYAREDDDSGVHWVTNPRFAHVVLPPEEEGAAAGDEANNKVALSTRAQLAAARSRNEAARALEACFGAKLRNMLQMSEAAFRTDAALIEMGVDSLVAVEIRAWFVKEVAVDMAVLMILGGASTVDLCQYALERIPKELLPGLESGAAGADNAVAAAPSSSSPAPPATSNKNDTPSAAPPVRRASLNAEGLRRLEAETQPRSAEKGHHIPKKESQLPTPSTSGSSHASSPTPFTQPETLEYPSPASSIAEDDGFMLVKEEKKQQQQHNKKKTPPETTRRVRISSAQARFWFLHMFLDDPTVSNVTLSYKISGRVRVADLARAVKLTANAHEALRTCFIADPDSPERASQGVMATSKVELVHKTVSSDADIKAAYRQVRDTVYDLEQGETMQVVLLSSDAVTHTIIFGYHHIVLDGVGFTAFLADLERAYKSQQPPSPQGLQYADFAEREGAALAEGRLLQPSLDYWKNEFRDMPPTLPLLPVARVTSRRAVDQYASSYVEQRLDPALAARLKARCKELRVTASHFYLAVFRVLLAQLSGVRDLCIGLADANRHDSNVMSTVGLFLNILPLRFRGPSTSFSDAVRETRDRVYGALSHAGVPFDELLQALQVPRSSGHSPLFQAFFDYHQGAQERLAFADTVWQVGDRNPGERRAYDITLDVIEGSAGSLVSLIGQEYLYGVPEMRRLLDCYLALLEQFVADPSVLTEGARLFSEEQVRAALDLGRGPSMVFEWGDDATLAHRVYDICRQFPDAVALRDGRGDNPGGGMTYRDLAKRAREIRDALVAGGVRPGDRVGVLQEASPDWICSVIAIFWAGAVYVPMVLLNPVPRLAAILRAARPTAVLVHDATAQLVSQVQAEAANDHQVKTINVARLPPAATAAAPGANADAAPVPGSGEDPAVILFTSGSTGTPKGIVLRHRNLAHHIEGYVRSWDIGRDQVVLQQSAFSFDLSIGQIFTALATGSTLVVAPEDARRDPAALAALVRREAVTWTLCTPSEYLAMLHAAPHELRQAASTSWKHALACGETLPRKLVGEFASLLGGQQQDPNRFRLYNCYGPAEAIISATMAEIPLTDSGEDDGPVTVGRPNPNYSIYIVDEHRQPVPQGFPGEIVIGGCGVGVGYLNEEQLTRDKFLRDTGFESSWDRQHGWTVCYRTGDRGRLRADGSLMHEGRLEGDSQVKIRGFRVDLLDVETTLLNAAHGVLADAVVTMRGAEDGGQEEQLLVAHVVFAPDYHRKWAPQEQAAYLRGLLANLPLPAYMKPSVAVPLDELPKNLHGKKDRRAIRQLALPRAHAPGAPSRESDAPAAAAADPAAEQALDPVERRLAETWREVLPAEVAQAFAIGRDTDFFAVGGNSLLLVKLQARIRNVFNVSLPLLQLLDASVLSKMAALIGAARVVDEVDWEKETALDPDLLALAAQQPQQPPPRKNNKTVVLTGATGYLGPYLLDQLLSDPSVATVHCVAVRAADPAQAASSRLPPRIAADPRIVVHAGDLAAPRLGLPEPVFAGLQQSADLIVHSGAARSFWDSYYTLRGANVESTRTLLRLAAPRRVPLHFLSTSGVLHLLRPSDYPSAVAHPSSVAHAPPPRDGKDGYGGSKWASEALLEKAAARLRIPVSIHRFTPRADAPVTSLLDGDKGDQGTQKAAALEALEDLLAPTARLGALPARSTWAGRFDVVRSAALARGVLGDGNANNDDADGPVPIRFVHHPSEAALTPAQLFDFLEARLGASVPRHIGLLEWVGAIKRLGYGWLFSTHDLSLSRSEGGVETTLVNRR